MKKSILAFMILSVGVAFTVLDGVTAASWNDIVDVVQGFLRHW